MHLPLRVRRKMLACIDFSLCDRFSSRHVPGRICRMFSKVIIEAFTWRRSRNVMCGIPAFLLDDQSVFESAVPDRVTS